MFVIVVSWLIIVRSLSQTVVAKKRVKKKESMNLFFLKERKESIRVVRKATIELRKSVDSLLLKKKKSSFEL